MEVVSALNRRGLGLSLSGLDYFLSYPGRAWAGLSDGFRQSFMNHISFLTTVHLPFILDKKVLEYNTLKPVFYKMYKRLIRYNIPYFAENDGVSPGKYFELLKRSRYIFEGVSSEPPDFEVETAESAVLGFTFGKESLLLYGLCRELGVDSHLVYFEEADPFDYYENGHKRRLAHNFEKKHAHINFIENSLSLLRYYEHFDAPETQVGWMRLMTEYTLMLLPLAHEYSSSYILWGNEKSCDDYYVTDDGHHCNPSFDQSSMWTNRLDDMAKGLTEGKVSTLSPVKPIHELAIIKILHHRYPDLGRYQMSCFTDDEYGRYNRWCHHCTKCARNYVMMLAAGVNPKSAGFKQDMMDKKYSEYFSLFPEKTTAHTTYDISGLGRDEQLLSFLLAYENKAKGKLIDRFKKGFIKEARAREDELRKKFLQVHSDRLPKPFNESKSIYREELAGQVTPFN